MRLGLRLQLLLALGALLVLAFVPLFVAVASLARATMQGVRESSAKALGRSVASLVLEAKETRRPDELTPLLEAQLGPGGVAAIGVYSRGKRELWAGEETAASALPERTGTDERSQTIATAEGAALLVLVPDARRRGEGDAVAVVLRTDPSTVPVGPLVRLVALYTGLVGLALLVFAYFAMTRLVVRPVLALSMEAARVAEGGRSLAIPTSGARELAELGTSLARMTTALRAEEAALRDKVAALEKARRELENAQEILVRSERLASVGRLSAGLAHEIGNPLSAVLGFQELMLSGGLEPQEERDFLVRMKRETERITKILRDLLDFARPAAAGPTSDVRGRASVAEVVSDVGALVKPQKPFRDVVLDVRIEPGLPGVALAHERLVQVLLNLLLNAADALPEGRGRVVLEAARAGEGRVCVSVEDDGPGVAAEVREHLFEPFVTTKDVGKGTGLGLAVCRGLVEAAGGSIRLAETGTLGGARFVLDLPAAGEIV